MTPKVQIVAYIVVAVVILGIVAGAVLSGEKVELDMLWKIGGSFVAGGFFGKVLKQPS